MLDQIVSHLSGQKQTVIDVQRKLVGIPALAPENGGNGERAKADFLKEYLKSIGVNDVREFNAPDPRVPCGHRPNLMAMIPGKDASRTFWNIAHMDVVPPGDRALWKCDPFELVAEGDIVSGRGTLDNQQGLVGALLVAKALKEKGIVPPINYGLVFVSDEETGNAYGADFLMRNHHDIFNTQDLFLIPDFGNETSELIDVAEKSVLWVKVTVLGKQCHAARPSEGVNSLTAASAFILKTRDLHRQFDQKDELFYPPFSTFEPTKKEANVQNVNTMPGRDVFYIDCRVLPDYQLQDILAAIRTLGGDVSKEYGVKIEVEVVQSTQAPPPTPNDCEILKRLVPAIRSVYGCSPKPTGVGCFTVAICLRRAGFPVVVWGTHDDCAHQPNEFSRISKTIDDAKVMAHVLFG
jgi:succinyl-diaminopimelate desuccinylase